MLANVIVTALALIRTPTITWLLPKEEVGMIGVVASWLPFIQLISMPGIDSSSYHYVAKGQPWAFGVNLATRLRWSILSAGAYILGGAYWWFQGETVLAWFFFVAGFSYPVTAGLSACSGTLGARENFVGLFWYRIADSISDFAGFIPIVFSIWWLSQGVTFYTSNQIATAILQVSVSLWLLARLTPKSTESIPAEEQQEMIRYGKSLTGVASLGVAQTRMDALLVGLLLPLEVMADYSIALLVYSQFKRLWSIYVSVRYPPLVRLPKPRRLRRIVAESFLCIAAFCIFGVATYGAIRWLIPLVLPASYAQSVNYSAWLIIAFVCLIPGAFAEIFFRTEQDERTQYWLRGVSAVAGLIIPLPLIYIWGTQGLLVGRVLTSITFSIFGAVLIGRQMKSA